MGGEMNRNERIQRLLAVIPGLSDYRLELVDRVASVFSQPCHPKILVIQKKVLTKMKRA